MNTMVFHKYTNNQNNCQLNISSNLIKTPKPKLFYRSLKFENVEYFEF